MMLHLARLLPDFAGEANRTRCFLHIVNLVAKTLIKQFDAPKKGYATPMEAADQELQDLTRDLEPEEGEGERDNEEDDNEEGWINEIDELDTEEQVRVTQNVRPIRLLLFKASPAALSLAEADE
jgi:hypothetical protein